MRTTAELLAFVGGLSKPSKMPGYAYGIPAVECKVGSLLRKVRGSTCAACYALKGMYSFPVVKKAQYRRLASISRPGWVQAMAELIARKSKDIPYFRWHDAGDLQSVEHLEKIVDIAKLLPRVKFWLPTRERTMVREFLSSNPQGFPRNLTVRISAPMIGKRSEPLAHTVGSSVNNPDAKQCPAPKQGGECRECRACWNRNVLEVSYSKH